MDSEKTKHNFSGMKLVTKGIVEFKRNVSRILVFHNFGCHLFLNHHVDGTWNLRKIRDAFETKEKMIILSIRDDLLNLSFFFSGKEQNPRKKCSDVAVILWRSQLMILCGHQGSYATVSERRMSLWTRNP